MKNMREFLKPWWTKLIIVLCLTVVTYASVSETVIRLNLLGKAASEVCYSPKALNISGSDGKTKVANAINSYLISSRSASPYNKFSNPGMAFVDAGSAYGVNPLLLFAITDVETGSATKTGGSMSCANPFGQRVKDAEKSTKRWCCTSGAESCTSDSRWYVYSNDISQALINEQAGLIKANYLDKGITTFNDFITDYGSSASASAYRALMDQLITNSGSALSCDITTTTKAITTTTKIITTTKSITTTTIAAPPSCSFGSSSYSSTPAASLPISYSTANASTARICSSAGSCVDLAVGSGKVWEAKPTQPTTYTMTVANSQGSRTCTTNVTMPSPSCGFHETSYSTTLGTAKALTYSTYGADSVVEICSAFTCKSATEANLVGAGAVGPNKTWSANPTQSTQYTLKVKSASGATATCKTNMTVK